MAFDIKGAFDRVTDTRLIKRLWKQNIPLSIIRWVASFLNNRTAAVRLDGETNNQEPLKIGVPQGSPVAPILFMLFTAPLFKIFTKEDKNAGIKIRGYVDDGLLTARAPKEDTSAKLIQATFAKVEAWAAQSGMIFDQAKLEAIHFSRKQNFPNPEIIFLSNATVGVEERIIKPTSKKGSMRWLGVYFDSRLSFSDHATAALRLHKLETHHPLRIRTKQAHITAHPSRLERLARKCSDDVEYLDPFHKLEPWEQPLFDSDSCLKATGGTGNKEKAITKFNSWLKSQNPLDVMVYTDS